MKYLKAAYRFKPLRTAAQALAAAEGLTALAHVDWKVSLLGAAGAGLLSFLQITAEGGDLFADDKRVTDSKVA